MKIGKYIYKTAYFSKLFLISNYNKLKLSLIWSVGKNFKSEGSIYIPAIKGDIYIGNNVWFGPEIRIGATDKAKIIIGNNVSINQGSFVIARESIRIGNDCRIGEYVSIRDNDHEWHDPKKNIREQGFITKPIEIENDVWIGRCVSILKGVKIGRGAIVASNAVVTKDILPYQVVAGVPAKPIGERSENYL